MSSPLIIYYNMYTKETIDHPHLLTFKYWNQKSRRGHIKFISLKYIHHINLYEQVISLSININLITNPNHRNNIKFKLQATKESHVPLGALIFIQQILSIYSVPDIAQGAGEGAINLSLKRSHQVP